MSERTCPHCGKSIIAPDARWCAYCGRELVTEPSVPGTGAGEVGAPPPPATAAPETPQEAGGPVAPQPGAPTTSPEPVPVRTPASAGGVGGPPWPSDGLRRCTDCGEALYASEHVCWNCGRRLDLSASEVPPPDVTAGVPPQTGAAAPASPAASPSGPAPAPAGAPPPQPVQVPAEEPVDPEISGTAWWAFGLGLASVFTCGLLSILGPVAIWLGVRANRRGGGALAVAGIVFGILGTLVLVVWLLGLALALMGHLGVGRPMGALLPLAPGGLSCA